MRQKGLCMRCLKRGHLAANCEATCESCCGAHHAAICGSIHVVSAQAIDKAQTSVRLMTTRVTMMNPKTKKRIVCDTLLDSGSTVSMVALSLVNDLGIDISKTHRTMISGVNGDSPVRDYPVVKPVVVHGRRKKTMEFTAIVKVSPISAMISCGKLDDADLEIIRKHTRYLNHAKAEYSFIPSVLFGVEEYLHIVKDKSKLLPSGYTLHVTALGPIVTGGSSLDTVIMNHSIDIPDVQNSPNKTAETKSNDSEWSRRTECSKRTLHNSPSVVLHELSNDVLEVVETPIMEKPVKPPDKSPLTIEDSILSKYSNDELMEVVMTPMMEKQRMPPDKSHYPTYSITNGRPHLLRPFRSGERDDDVIDTVS